MSYLSRLAILTGLNLVETINDGINEEGNPVSWDHGVITRDLSLPKDSCQKLHIGCFRLQHMLIIR